MNNIVYLTEDRSINYVYVEYLNRDENFFDFALVLGGRYKLTSVFNFFDDKETTEEEIRESMFDHFGKRVVDWPALDYMIANKDYVFSEAIKLKIKCDL